METNTILDNQYKVFKRPVKSARLEYTKDGLRVIVPVNRPFDVDKFVREFEPWIMRKRKYYDNLINESKNITLETRSDAALFDIVKMFVAEAESSLKATAQEIRFREMKRQWGNCSSRGRLTFNKRLRRLPDHLIRYIVYHEVCHLRSLRHGKLFRKTMLRFFPEIKKHEQELTAYAFRLGLEE
jgi:predicted metal-dependent hydrolase